MRRDVCSSVVPRLGQTQPGARRALTALAATALVSGALVAATSAIGIGVAPAAAAAPTFSISPTSLDFGDVTVGSTSPSQTITVTNTSTASIVMSGTGGAAGVFGGGANDCQGTALAPGASCHMTYAFSPVANGPVTGSASGTWNTQAFAFAFKGNGIDQFLITPRSFDFGNVPLGSTSPPQTVTVTNRGVAPVKMSGTAGGAGVFSGAQNCQNVTLAPNASCQMLYTFTPAALGPVAGTASGAWSGQGFTIGLAGNGIRRFLISPTSIDFGDVPIGTTGAPHTVTVTNMGFDAVVMAGAVGAGGVFVATQNCQGITLAPGASCQMSFAFRPTVLGPATGSSAGSWNGQAYALSFTGNATAGPGRPPAPASVLAKVVGSTVALTWTPPASDGGSVLTGYLITSTPPGASFTVSAGSTSVTIGGLSAATTYTFTVAAQNAFGTGPGSRSNPVTLGVVLGAGLSRDYVSVVPVRVLETRPTQVGYTGAKPSAGQVVQVKVTGLGSPAVDVDAVAVVLNVTGTEASAAGFVTVWPCGQAQPTVSNLNLVADGTAPNLVVVKVGAEGKVCLFTQSGTHLVADLQGFFPAGTSFVPVLPERLLDTRVPQTGYTGSKPAAGQTVQLQVTGAGATKVPIDATAVVVNVTGAEAATAGFVTVWPCGQPQPTVSNLNLVAGGTTPNLVVVKLGANGKVCLFTQSGTHLLADVQGYFPAASPSFVSVQPERLLETRPVPVGYTGAKPAAGQTVELQVTGAGATKVPTSAVAVVLNVTGTEATASGFVTVWPCGQPKPTASNVNLLSGGTSPNLAIVAVGVGGKVCLFTQSGTHLLADVQGYFLPTA